jgi:hypothetical protein
MSYLCPGRRLPRSDLAITGPHAFLWPVFIIGIWDLGLVMNAWDVYRKEITEPDIRREMEREDGRT